MSASRRGKVYGPVDLVLKAVGLSRRVTLVVPTVSAALFAAAGSDLVATVAERTGTQVVGLLGLVMFKLPVKTPRLDIYHCWHPRFDADPEHR